MSLITASNFLAYCDRLAAAYTQTKAGCGTSAGNAANGTTRGTIANLLALVVGLADFDQENDLAANVNNALALANVENMFGPVAAPLIAALNTHCAHHGLSVDASIASLQAFLAYYNGGGGAAKFANLVTPDFAQLFAATAGTLAAGYVMSPAIQPDYTAAASAHGMGDRSVGGGFNAGDAVNTALYSEVPLVIEVLTAFANGTGHPTVTVTGVDDQGTAGVTWGPIDLGADNPAAALAGLTVTPAITAAARQTVAVSSSAGIVPYSVVTVNKGLPDQETVVVEAVPDGTRLAAVFTKAHAGGATIDGWTSFAAGNASSGSGRRCRQVTGITIGTTGHNAGKVRVAGGQPRVAV